MDIKSFAKINLSLLLVMNFILSGCLPSDKADPMQSASAQTGSTSGSTTGGTVAPGSTLPTVEIRHLIEPNLSTDPTYSTGTGIGPYLSMLGTETPWQRFSSIVLLHSVRFAAELAYQPLISQFQQRYGTQLRYQPIVTREAYAGALQQRIPELISSGTLQQICGQSLDAQSQVLLCGNPQMITETKTVLESLGLKKNLRRDPGQITVEQYWK